jgi:molybdopterin molybdotransferase
MNMGAEIIHAETIRDDEKDFECALAASLDVGADFIVSSGAVSAGDFDFVRPCLEQLGATILYHKVKMKPGKPNLLARLPNGTLYFGLPGNPVATAVGLRFFMHPAIAAMYGGVPEKPLTAIAANAFSKKPGLHMFLKGHWQTDDHGTLKVTFLEGQASFMVRPFLNMNCWIAVPEERGDVLADDTVAIYSA